MTASLLRGAHDTRIKVVHDERDDDIHREINTHDDANDFQCLPRHIHHCRANIDEIRVPHHDSKG